MHVSWTYQRTSVRDLTDDDLKLGLLGRLEDLDTQFVEVLCIEVHDLWDDETLTVEAIEETLDRWGASKR